MKGYWVHVENHLLRDDICANGDEFTGVIGSEGVVVHLARQSAGCIVSIPAHRGNTHCSGVLIHLDEEKHGNISFEATLLSWVPHSLHQ